MDKALPNERWIAAPRPVDARLTSMSTPSQDCPAPPAVIHSPVPPSPSSSDLTRGSPGRAPLRASPRVTLQGTGTTPPLAALQHCRVTNPAHPPIRRAEAFKITED